MGQPSERGTAAARKVRRVDLAIEQFQTGWSERPARNSIQCGFELARLHAGKGEIDRFRRLLDEADAMFDRPGFPFDGHFYTEIVRIALEPALERSPSKCGTGALGDSRAPCAASTTGKPPVRWSRNGWASQSSGRRVAELTPSLPWPPRRRGRAGKIRSPAIEIRRPIVFRSGGAVTAVCQAIVSGEIFLGFEHGLVCALEPELQQVTDLPKAHGAVVPLSVDPQGQSIAALFEHKGGLTLCFLAIARMAVFLRRGDCDHGSRAELAHPDSTEGRRASRRRQRRRLAATFSTWLRGCHASTCESPTPILKANCRRRDSADLGPGNARSASRVTVLTHDQSEWVVFEPVDDSFSPSGCKWLPGQKGVHSLRWCALITAAFPAFACTCGG